MKTAAVAAVALLALGAAASTEFEYQRPEVLKTFESLAAGASPFVPSGAAGEGECGECFRQTVEGVMEHTFEHIRHECEEVECPFIKARCEFIREHKHFFAGLLFVKLRPPQTAAAYCTGTGACSEGADMDAILDAFVDVGSVARKLYKNAPEGAMALDDSTDISLEQVLDLVSAEEEDADVPGEADSNSNGDGDSDSDSDSDGDHDGHHGHHGHHHGRRVFEHCVRHLAEHRTSRIISHIVRFCVRTECPRAKEWCERITSSEASMEAFSGEIVAHDEPAKYATGMCEVFMWMHRSGRRRSRMGHRDF